MNVLTELWVGMPLGSYTATRGWNEDQISRTADGLRASGLVDGDTLTADGRRFRDDIEASTDVLEQPIVDALGEDFDRLVQRLATWSQRCIDAEAFPPDPYKRAAG